MIYFERIYVCFYFLLIHIRRFSKIRSNERLDALFPFLLSQLFPLAAFVTVYCNLNSIPFPNLSKFEIVVVMFLPFIPSYFYFVSNRNRSNRIIDSYRYLSERTKRVWTTISLLLIALPIFVIIFFLNK